MPFDRLRRQAEMSLVDACRHLAAQVGFFCVANGPTAGKSGVYSILPSFAAHYNQLCMPSFSERLMRSRRRKGTRKEQRWKLRKSNWRIWW